MSDTSTISTASTYRNHHRKDLNRIDEDTTCCKRYWFILLNSFLLIIIVTTSVLIIYFLNKQAERDRDRQRIKDEFKRKHHVANKVLDTIMKDGFVYKWLKNHKGSIAKTFQELFEDITKTLFEE